MKNKNTIIQEYATYKTSIGIKSYGGMLGKIMKAMEDRRKQYELDNQWLLNDDVVIEII